MEDECGSGSVSDRPFLIPRSEKKSMVGEKRSSTEFGGKWQGGRRVKLRDLESVLRSEGIDTHYPKSSENKEANNHFLSTENEKSQVTGESLETVKLDIAQAGKLGRDSIPLQTDPTPKSIDLNTNFSSSEKQAMEQNVNSVNPRGFRWDLNADVSSPPNENPFYPYKNLENVKARDASECGSTTGPLEEKDPMRVWKEMKQNGFLSSNHGGIPMPKPRGRKSKNDGMKKKMELAKREQVDRFAKIAAPSGLLNELNPGIINHVRNSKQVHSIIEALVRSEKLENRHGGAKKGIQTKSGKESSDRKENLNDSGVNQLNLSHGDGSLNTFFRSQNKGGYPMSMDGSVCLNSEKRVFAKTICPSDSNPDREDDILALKLSSTTMVSENTSSLSNEESANLTSVSSLSFEAANIASQWLELLHQDINGRLLALRRSKKRVRAVIHTELPLLMTREFSSNQENDPRVSKNSSDGCDGNASVDVHRARWRALFDQMDKALSEEEKQLESWLNQVREMQLHCERGLQHFQYNALHGLQQLGENDPRLEKEDNSEMEMAIRAAAASIYSTCNFLLSTENLPCF